MRSIASAVTGVLAALALAVGASSAGFPAPATFTDPAGDSQGAPDITAVSVSSDAAARITFKVTVAGFSTVAPGMDNLTKVYIDADRDESTGATNQGGVEYALVAWKAADGSGWVVDRWNGSKYVTIPQSAAMGFSRSGDVLSWTVGAADLGGTTGFEFFVWSSQWDSSDQQVAEDVSPDDGWFTYTLPAVQPPSTSTATTTTAKAVPKPLIEAPISTPLTAVAGKRFTVVFPVVRGDNGKPMTLGKLVCDPSVLGKVIPHAESFTGGKARLSFVIPKGAQGKVLKVKVTIVAGTQSATRTAGFKVV
jgi:hypothetical protein